MGNLSTEEKTKENSFDVVLEEKGDHVLAVVKAVRDACGLSLKGAHDLVYYGIPATIKEGLSESEAKNFKKLLEEAGAKVRLIGSIEEQENEEELSDFESVLFSAFSDGWQRYLHEKELNVAQWAKEHSAEILEAAKQLLKQQ